VLIDLAYHVNSPCMSYVGLDGRGGAGLASSAVCIVTFPYITGASEDINPHCSLVGKQLRRKK
jgi:hypothetical protein